MFRMFGMFVDFSDVVGLFRIVRAFRIFKDFKGCLMFFNDFLMWRCEKLSWGLFFNDPAKF